MPGGNGRNSKRQTGKTHHDSLGQSGQQRSSTPKPQRGNRGGRGGGMTFGQMLFGPGPRSMSHGGSKKGRKKGRGSR